MRVQEIIEQHPETKPALLYFTENNLKLYPPQIEALKKNVLFGKNLLLCSGTGSGKTLIAKLAALKTIKKGGKVVYTVPLRALAMEKFSEFEELGVKTAVSIGDYDSRDSSLSGFDIIITTFEKLDSLIRHRTKWLKNITLMVYDEIHELGSDRGATLEMVRLKMKKISSPHEIFLSATIGNAKELSSWLDAGLVESDFRPVPLSEGVFLDGKIYFKESEKEVKGKTETSVIKDAKDEGHQSIAFLNTRREARALAEKTAGLIGEETPERKELSEKILKVLPKSTEQCERLAECVRCGVAFHHAGLVHKQRALIEDAFRKGTIFHISATITLAAGLNLPARRIIIRSLRRFTGKGMKDWPVSLYKQAAGRAGRVRYDDRGECVIISKTDEEKERYFESYIDGTPEAVYSRIGIEPVLRREVLALVASGFVNERKELLSFLGKTFYAHQYGDMKKIEEITDTVSSKLEKWGFMEDYWATKLGVRVSELYIDPWTAKLLLERLDKAPTSPFGYLLSAAFTPEMQGGYVRKEEFEELYFELKDRREELLFRPPGQWDHDFEKFLRGTKLSLILLDYINEKSEKEILKKRKTAPGDLRRMVYNFDWLLYSMSELSSFTCPHVRPQLERLRKRVNHGVKEELLDLIEIKGIGRVRARKLYNSGIRKKSSIKGKEKKIRKLLPGKLAEKIIKKYS